MAWVRALSEAGMESSQVDLVVPHGIGAPASDQYEARLLHQIFGGAPSWPAITALKPMIGHSLGASGLMEAVLLVGALARGMVPPTFGHSTPFSRNAVPLVAEWRTQPIHTAVKLTCAFGGFYGAVAFRRFEPDRP